MSGSKFSKAKRKVLHGNHFVIEIFEKMQQIFNADGEHVRLEMDDLSSDERCH